MDKKINSNITLYAKDLMGMALYFPAIADDLACDFCGGLQYIYEENRNDNTFCREFKAALSYLLDENQPIDMITVSEQMHERGIYKGEDLAERIAELAEWGARAFDKTEYIPTEDKPLTKEDRQEDLKNIAEMHGVELDVLRSDLEEMIKK